MANIGLKLYRLFSSKVGESSGKASKVLQSATGGRSLVESVQVLKNGQGIVAWHPDPVYPYELSQPLPTVQEAQSASLLKDEALRTAMSSFSRQRPEVAREELMRLTYTCKHRWFPRARDKRAKKTPMDRPYL